MTSPILCDVVCPICCQRDIQDGDEDRPPGSGDRKRSEQRSAGELPLEIVHPSLQTSLAPSPKRRVGAEETVGGTISPLLARPRELFGNKFFN